LESYLNKADVRDPIIVVKPYVWSPIIAIISEGSDEPLMMLGVLLSRKRRGGAGQGATMACTSPHAWP
jgi:hypothetical protein